MNTNSFKYLIHINKDKIRVQVLSVHTSVISNKVTRPELSPTRRVHSALDDGILESEVEYFCISLFFHNIHSNDVIAIPESSSNSKFSPIIFS